MQYKLIKLENSIIKVDSFTNQNRNRNQNRSRNRNQNQDQKRDRILGTMDQNIIPKAQEISRGEPNNQQ